MDELQDYSKIYPNLPIEIILFFSEWKIKEKNTLIHQTVLDFCQFYHKKYNSIDFPQPRIIAKICNILVDNHILTLLGIGGPDNTYNSYLFVIKEKSYLKDGKNLNLLNKQLSYLIYGFRYIYDEYKKFVLPVEYVNNSDDISLGTCFLYNGGIVTAKHCIENAKKISIQGIPKEYLKEASFEIHKNNLMDLLFIRLKNTLNDSIDFSEKADILDEVMTLGYPKIPGYHNYLVAENAKVSARYTTLVGQIASYAEDIWIKEKLFLITAKIKGGNSGGPVINKQGAIVGVTVNVTESEGNYDELGYGTVIPVSFLDELIRNENKNYLNISKIIFNDFDR